MKLHPLAGKPVPASMLDNIPRLLAAYYTIEPSGPVSFGTSGHRGCSLKGTFNEMHIAANSQAERSVPSPFWLISQFWQKMQRRLHQEKKMVPEPFQPVRQLSSP